MNGGTNVFDHATRNGNGHATRPSTPHRFGGGFGLDSSSDDDEGPSRGVAFTSKASVSSSQAAHEQAIRAVTGAWHAYLKDPRATGANLVSESIHRTTAEFTYVLRDCEWSELRFVECLLRQGAAGTSVATPEGMSQVRIIVCVTATNRVDLGAIAKESMRRVKASALYQVLVVLLCLAIVWGALHASSFDHAPYTWEPLRSIVTSIRTYSSS